jgi:transposase-like protein
VLGIYISEKRNMLVAEKFIRSLVEKNGNHIVYTDGGTWYHEAYNIIGLKHYLYLPLKKSLMERVNQYFKHRTESLMIIIHVKNLEKQKEKNAIYYMYIIGSSYLFICIMQRLETKFYSKLEVK